MKKYRVDYTWWLRIDRRPNLYAVESEYTNIMYVFTRGEVMMLRGRDVWRMNYREAEDLADRCVYPAIRNEFKELISDAKWLKRQGSVMFQ